ncbi:hypothetical protein EYF80_056692 [Liparis tanakae]|uniref:Uncharacterized protein n=1 Tax=Liparis tanakae TaxID=230148 RepID=A0A4Z2EWA5_9TELE|nr:hypothetical protein EYF80_056692 [Liparis tanakae]
MLLLGVKKTREQRTVEGLPLPGLVALLVSPLPVLAHRQLPVASPGLKAQVARRVQPPAELLRVLRPGQRALRPAVGPGQGPVAGPAGGGRAGEA